VAYVQLKPGMDVTEADLLDFARGHIGERAALPKAFRIIPAMPLTSVGKIFKPELKRRETEDALSEALCSGGVAFASLRVQDDPTTHGTTVEVILAKGQAPQRAQSVLGQFAIRFNLAE